MNKERLLKLADMLEASESFTMSEVFHGTGGLAATAKNPCGTPACIMGHAEVLRRQEEPDEDYSWRIASYDLRQIERYLGISEGISSQLFFPEALNGMSIDYLNTKVQGKRAARVVRRLVKTEEVVW